jgi:hypothetical protein
MTTNEPTIVINGHTLTDAQAMTVRVAVNNFLHGLREDDALGDDEHGRAMVTAYRDRLNEIVRMMRS